jgi:hypothetical protein
VEEYGDLFDADLLDELAVGQPQHYRFQVENVLDPKVLHELRHIANQRGGECLSRRYVNTLSRLQWRCALGHQRHATLASIIRTNTWCPVCAGNRKLKLKDLSRIARERGGKCLSRKYFNAHTPLQWECKSGHRWKAAAEQVKAGLHRKGTWCPRCYDERRCFRPKATIEDMRNLASIRGGTCGSDCYSGSLEQLLWRCAKGHQWYAVPGRIKRGSWCPVCAGNQKLKLKDYRRLAASNGGKCLSMKYKNNDAKLRWRCAKGPRMACHGIKHQARDLVCKVRARHKERRFATQTRTSVTPLLLSNRSRLSVPIWWVA